MAASTIRLPKKRQILEELPLSQSEASLPIRKPTVSSIYASTLTPLGSRSASPAGRSSAALSGTTLGSTFTKSLLETPAADTPGDPLNLILKSFVPHIAIYSSPDTDELAREKGFTKGLWELLRPFGERIQGKVTVRDSNGAPKTWDDFSVRFVQFGAHIEHPEPVHGSVRSPVSPPALNGQSRIINPQAAKDGTTANRMSQVETVVSRHLSYAEESFLGLAHPSTPTKQTLDLDVSSPYYALYLRRLLSGIPLAGHETFAHPVACVIAISSRNPTPIQAFRELYREISQGDKTLPPWVDGDYLRYYVLVHDEESGDIAKSMALFEQMKRHLGLHCHLLRIRSTQSAETDDDSIPLPRSDWMTPAEELADIERSEADEAFDDVTKYIFESDATAIRTFIREMVTQSIVPTMERSVSLWNDQVASKRKGISGKFMTFSKRFTGFGGGSRTPSLSGGGGGGSNYDVKGFYGADSPEAIMRKLADYAFMLRDWKLAMQIYDIVRSDFSNDKAWKYHAAANEMAAYALLIMPQNMSSRTKLETINSMLEQAFYSYNTRCGTPQGAFRCLALGLELLRLRGGQAIDEAVKWGMRLLEAHLVGAIGEALLKERMAVCCATKQGVGSLGWGSWKRKSAFWSVLATEAWLNQGKYIQAQRCLNEARKMYSMLQSDEGISGFALASEFLAQLQHRLKEGLSGEAFDTGGVVDEEVELLDDEDMEMMNRHRRPRQPSVIGGAGAPAAALETAPLRRMSIAGDQEDLKSPDNDFG